MILQEVLDIVKNSHIEIKSLVVHNGLTHVEVPLKTVLKDKSGLKREVLHFRNTQKLRLFPTILDSKLFVEKFP